MQDAYVDLATPAMDGAGELGASFYNAAGVVGAPEDVAVIATAPPADALKINARWAMSTGDAVTGLQLLSGSMQRRIYDTARQSIEESAQREPGALWARQARANACPFCRMLATRKAVYSSSEAALQVVGRTNRRGRHDSSRYITGRTRGSGGKGSRYHDHCRCLAVAVRPGQSYSPPSYAQDWEQQYIDARKRATSGDPKAITRAWEEMLDAKDEGARSFT